MAAGVFNGKFVLGGSPVTLDSLTGGTQTYSVITLRRVDGAIQIGNASLNQANGFPLVQGELTLLSGSAVLGSALNLLGPGTVEFFGSATA